MAEHNTLSSLVPHDIAESLHRLFLGAREPNITDDVAEDDEKLVTAYIVRLTAELASAKDEQAAPSSDPEHGSYLNQIRAMLGAYDQESALDAAKRAVYERDALREQLAESKGREELTRAAMPRKRARAATTRGRK